MNKMQKYYGECLALDSMDKWVDCTISGYCEGGFISNKLGEVDPTMQYRIIVSGAYGGHMITREMWLKDKPSDESFKDLMETLGLPICKEEMERI